MQIITISREFGSGGRELGKRMADLLQFAYFDREIVSAIAQKNQMDEGYVADIIEMSPAQSYPITVGRTFAFPPHIYDNATKILVEEQKVIRELAAKGNCVVMGQGADTILQEHQPLNIFVYADMEAKMSRCRERATAEDTFTDRELKKKIRQVDAGRARRHEWLTNKKWGAKESYHLCINTTDLLIKTLAPHIAEYAQYWLGR